MYVSDDRKFAYIHIPKTGGTAIRKGLLDDTEYRRVGDKHGGVDQLPAHCDEKYFIFAMVRNPYQRLVSQFRFRTIRDRHKGLFAERYPTLTDFLGSEVIRTKTRPGKHPISQTDLIDDRVLWFQFERFDTAVQSMCGLLGMYNRKIERDERTNSFGSYIWTDYMTERALEIINDEARADFDLFGYRVLTWDQVQGHPETLG